MYSNKQNILQLVALLKAFEIKQVVLSPGSRNSPIIHSIASDPYFRTHTIVDERSAGFVAIGIMQQTKQPVAVCCTSGTALLNLSPSVAEAYYQQLPLVVITADRPQAWIGQMDGQTIPQPDAFRSLVKRAVQLPEPTTPEETWYCNRLINEALLALDHHGRGPVHINIPLSEPLFEYTVASLPEVRRINRVLSHEIDQSNLITRFEHYNKRMIIVGQGERNPKLVALLEQLNKKYKCVILAEHLSNIQSPYVIGNFDSILHTLAPEALERYAPDLVITMGGHLVSKRIKHYLRTHPPKAHWHVSSTGEVVDLFQCVTKIVEADAITLARQLLTSRLNLSMDTHYAPLWSSRSAKILPPDVAFSDLYAVKRLMQAIPTDAALHLANSSSVRFAQLFGLHPAIEVGCNRGTNGIDGSLSAAMGYALVSNRLTFLLIGDLSFFYDMNALWMHATCPNIRILVNNNGGGEIFYSMPELHQSEALPKQIVASHSTSAKAWAESAGFRYLSASHAEELSDNLPAFVDKEINQPILLEVFSSMESNTEILRTYYNTIKTEPI